MISLETICLDFAKALSIADSKGPVCHGRNRSSLPGLGPHGEDRAVELTLSEMKLDHPERYREYCGQHLPYPDSKQKVDLWLGSPLEWVLEVKMARFFGDNGKPDDTNNQGHPFSLR